ncbi:MAG: diguanylate cyclase [Candidatus Izemoplasmatales bacterium]
MTVFHWLLYIFLAVLTLIPLVRIDLFNVSEKYKTFKYLSMVIFVWSLIIGLRIVLTNYTVVYYLSLTINPLIYSFTVLTLISVMHFLEKRVPRILKVIFLTILILEIVLSYTNAYHQLILQIVPENISSYQDLLNAEYGILFYVHTAICYLILIIGLGSIIFRFYRNLVRDKDIVPFVLMIVSSFLGIAMNIIHIFVVEFVIDPTYITVVAVITLLYLIFLIRDLNIILKLGNNEFILDNLREIFLLVNHRGIIVAASEEFKNRFDFTCDHQVSFNEVKRKMSEKTVIFEDFCSIDSKFDNSKTYLNLVERDIKLPFLKQKGKFYIFYDDTDNQRNIFELNYVMTHDLMTKLYNRNHFESLEPEIEDNYDNYALIMFDLDGLKLFNDYLGHEAGDELLIRFSKNLTHITKDDDNLTAIRMGGDEFLMIAINKDMNDIEELIYELKSLCIDTDPLKNIGFSYGYAQNNFLNLPFKRVLREADFKLYSMKASRREQKETLTKYLKKFSKDNLTG